jgi:hypothetical protein
MDACKQSVTSVSLAVTILLGTSGCPEVYVVLCRLVVRNAEYSGPWGVVPFRKGSVCEGIVNCAVIAV